MDNEIIKHIFSEMHQRGNTWFTGAIVMAVVALISCVRLIFR